MNEVNIAYLSFTLGFVRSIWKRAAQGVNDSTETSSERAMRDAWNVFERIGEEFSISLSLEHANWHEIDDATFERYLKRVFDEIRGIAANAERDAESSRREEGSYDPYVSDLLAVLSIMQTHARSLGLDGRLVDLDRFDTLRSALAPYRSQ
jgi:hypothetical protein